MTDRCESQQRLPFEWTPVSTPPPLTRRGQERQEPHVSLSEGNRGPTSTGTDEDRDKGKTSDFPNYERTYALTRRSLVPV